MNSTRELRTCGVGESHESGARDDSNWWRRRVVEAAEPVPRPTAPRRRPVEFGGRRWSGGSVADLARTACSSGRTACQPVVTRVRRQRRADTGDCCRVVDVRNYRLHKLQQRNQASDPDKPRPVPRCRVLPLGEFNGMI